MKRNRITLYIDLLFCLVIIPLAIMLLPVDRWMANNTAFLITLVAYVYILYFVYRLSCIPKLFMQKKYIRIFVLLIILTSVTELLTYFPIPAEHITDDIRQMTAKMNIRKQTIWFFFLIVTGFSLAIELTFELFRQIISKQELEGFNLDAVDFLHKPFSYERFEVAVEKAIRRIESKRHHNPEYLIVKQEYNNVSIPLSDILYIEALGNYVKIFRKSGGHVLTRTNLKAITDLLPVHDFLRIHRSYVIPISSAVSFSRSKVEIEGNVGELPIGSQYVASVMDTLGK